MQPTDRVVELGAGVGTVAHSLPACAVLTLIELDQRLIAPLMRNIPGANVMNTDGVALLREHNISFDILISNLPAQATESLLVILPELDFRVAVLAIGSTAGLEQLGDKLHYSILATIEGNDFTPPQPARSILVRVERTLPSSV